MLPFTNTVFNGDGGTHLSGFRAALTRTFNTYGQVSGLLKNVPEGLSGEDVREGLTAVLSVKIHDPKFSSQTKDKLVSSNVKGWVESVVSARLGEYFEENPTVARRIVGKCVEAARGPRGRPPRPGADPPQGGTRERHPPGQARRLPGAGSRGSRAVPGGGRLAGGSAKQGRDRRFQAILPLKGKILNVEKARFDKMLASMKFAPSSSVSGRASGRRTSISASCGTTRSSS